MATGTLYFGKSPSGPNPSASLAATDIIGTRLGGTLDLCRYRNRNHPSGDDGRCGRIRDPCRPGYSQDSGWKIIRGCFLIIIIIQWTGKSIRCFLPPSNACVSIRRETVRTAPRQNWTAHCFNGLTVQIFTAAPRWNAETWVCIIFFSAQSKI